MVNIEDIINRFPKTSNEIKNSEERLKVLEIERKKTVELIEILSKNNIYDEKLTERIYSELKHILELDKEITIINEKIAKLEKKVEETIKIIEKMFEKYDESISKGLMEQPVISSGKESCEIEETIAEKKEKIQQTDITDKNVWAEKKNREEGEKKNQKIKEEKTTEESKLNEEQDNKEWREWIKDEPKWELSESEEQIMKMDIIKEDTRKMISDKLAEIFKNKQYEDLTKKDILNAIREVQQQLLSDILTNNIKNKVKSLIESLTRISKKDENTEKDLSNFADLLIKEYLLKLLVPKRETRSNIDKILEKKLKNQYFNVNLTKIKEIYEEFKEENLSQFNEIKFENILTEVINIDQFIDKLSDFIESNIFINLEKFKQEIQKFIERKIQLEIDNYIPPKNEWENWNKSRGQNKIDTTREKAKSQEHSQKTNESIKLPEWILEQINEELKNNKNIQPENIVKFLKNELKKNKWEIKISHIKNTFKDNYEEIIEYLKKLFWDYNSFRIIEDEGAKNGPLIESEEQEELTQNNNITEEERLIERIDNFSTISSEEKNTLYIDVIKYISQKNWHKVDEEVFNGDFNEWIQLFFNEWIKWQWLRKEIKTFIQTDRTDKLDLLYNLDNLYAISIIPLEKRVSIYLNKLKNIAEKINYTIREEAIENDFSEWLLWRSSLETKLIKILKKSLESESPQRLRFRTQTYKYMKLELMHASDEDPRRIIALPKKCGHKNIKHEIFAFCDHNRYESIIDTDPNKFRNT